MPLCIFIFVFKHLNNILNSIQSDSMNCKSGYVTPLLKTFQLMIPMALKAKSQVLTLTTKILRNASQLWSHLLLLSLSLSLFHKVWLLCCSWKKLRFSSTGAFALVFFCLNSFPRKLHDLFTTSIKYLLKESESEVAQLCLTLGL